MQDRRVSDPVRMESIIHSHGLIANADCLHLHNPYRSREAMDWCVKIEAGVFMTWKY